MKKFNTSDTKTFYTSLKNPEGVKTERREKEEREEMKGVGKRQKEGEINKRG